MAGASGTINYVQFGANTGTSYTSTALNATREMFETGDQLSNFKKFGAGNKGFEIPIEGVMDFADTYGGMYLLDAMINGTVLTFLFGKLATAGAITLAGSCLVKSWSSSFNMNSVHTFSAVLQVTGDLTPGTVASPITPPTASGSVNSGGNIYITWNAAVLAAQTEGSITVNRDMVPVTGKHSTGNANEYVYGELSADISFAGICDEALSNDHYDTLTALRAATSAAFIIGLTTGGTVSIEGTARCSNLSINAPKNAPITYSGSLKASSTISIDTV